MTASKKLVITIDGPAGAGKSTVSKELASQLGYIYVDTGAMYRAVAVLVKQTGENNPLDRPSLEKICSELELTFIHTDEEILLLANGEDVTEKIRNPEISSLASAVSAEGVVRDRLSKIQRRMGAEGGVVLEGRDMGTVVFPDADVKFFLDAIPEVRSRRRFIELGGEGEKVFLEDVHQQMLSRDRNDSSRQLAPLKAAVDAIVIDSSNLQVEEVVEVMIEHIDAKSKALSA